MPVLGWRRAAGLTCLGKCDGARMTLCPKVPPVPPQLFPQPPLQLLAVVLPGMPKPLFGLSPRRLCERQPAF